MARQLQSGDQLAMDLLALHKDLLCLCCDPALFEKVAALDEESLPEHMDLLQSLVSSSELAKFIFMSRLRQLRRVKLQQLIDRELEKLLAHEKIDEAAIAEHKRIVLEEADGFWVEAVVKRSAKIGYRGIGLLIKARVSKKGS